mgnify:CR=1 FL=1
MKKLDEKQKENLFVNIGSLILVVVCIAIIVFAMVAQ